MTLAHVGYSLNSLRYIKHTIFAAQHFYIKFNFIFKKTKEFIKNTCRKTLQLFHSIYLHKICLYGIFSYHFKLYSLVLFKNNSTIILKTRRHATTDFGKERKYGGTTYLSGCSQPFK